MVRKLPTNWHLCYYSRCFPCLWWEYSRIESKQNCIPQQEIFWQNAQACSNRDTDYIPSDFLFCSFKQSSRTIQAASPFWTVGILIAKRWVRLSVVWRPDFMKQNNSSEWKNSPRTPSGYPDLICHADRPKYIHLMKYQSWAAVFWLKGIPVSSGSMKNTHTCTTTTSIICKQIIPLLSHVIFLSKYYW